MEETLHVLLKQITTAQFTFMEDGETLLKHGALIRLVAADNESLKINFM